MATVFLNGSFVSRDEARISAFDAGFQHGVGLFETMLAARGTPWHIIHLREHMERLSTSAVGLGLTERVHTGVLVEAVERTVAKAGDDLPDAPRLRVRLTMTGGDLNLLEKGQPGSSSESEEGQTPTLMIVAQPATEYPAAMFERGASVVIADLRVNPLDPFAGHKTLNYWARLRELQKAAGKRAGESLIFQVTNHLSGGCVSNALIIKDGKMITPIARGEEQEVADLSNPGDGFGFTQAGAAVMPSPVLPGVTRRWAIDWARETGMEVERRMVTIDDVLGADEVLLTNSSWGVLPVVKVEREAIGDGVVGEIGKKLCTAWVSLVAGA